VVSKWPAINYDLIRKRCQERSAVQSEVSAKKRRHTIRLAVAAKHRLFGQCVKSRWFSGIPEDAGERSGSKREESPDPSINKAIKNTKSKV
jgi:hypothetical protein